MDNLFGYFNKVALYAYNATFIITVPGRSRSAYNCIAIFFDPFSECIHLFTASYAESHVGISGSFGRLVHILHKRPLHYLQL